MSLNGALQIGRSALMTSQAAMQVAGNNMANAATPGFNRRTIHMVPSRDEVIGRNQFVGTGVELMQIRREVDTALQGRLRDALAFESGALVDQRFLSSLETIQNELSSNDLSSVMSEFFNSFSELANNPEDNAVRSVVIQQGVNLASRIAGMASDYNTVRAEIDASLGTSITKVNDILDRIALLNRQISQTEQGITQAHALRDQRDQLLDELSGYFSINTIEQANGVVDVHIGSTPIVLAGSSRGVEARYKTQDGVIQVSLRVKADGTQLNIQDGRIGALVRQRDEVVQPAIDELDRLAQQLIFQVNRLHSQGQSRHGFTTVNGTYGVQDINQPFNTDAAGLPFDVGRGSFFIHVTNKETGLRTTHRIDVDGKATSMQSLMDEINTVVGVPNVTAELSADRSLRLSTNTGYEMSFSDDTSGVLAALGINTFFVGEDAASMDVSAELQRDPNLLAAGMGHVAGSNGTALAIADLQNLSLPELDGRSLREYWQQAVNKLAVKADAANAAVEAAGLVRENLAAQVQAISGVSLDEEAINLLAYQRQFQAAARFINVIDETFQTLLSLAR